MILTILLIRDEVVNGKKNDIIEIVYEYTLPRIMNGVYLVGAAVGQGTQSKHECLPGFMVLWNWKS